MQICETLHTMYAKGPKVYRLQCYMSLWVTPAEHEAHEGQTLLTDYHHFPSHLSPTVRLSSWPGCFFLQFHINLGIDFLPVNLNL